ncbi:MAG: NAD(P)-dependent methylenetetrahydromethanopterin dehydrogenase [Gemmataceae bacterium]
MSDKAKILLQLDSDPQPSVFDRVVAVDAGADHVFSYGGVKPEQVAGLIHGCIFTRSSKDLHRTAVFVGGSDVAAGEALLAEVQKTLLPKWGLQVSVLLDPNGANTTAAAAVRAAARHLELKNAKAVVLGGTGPVGQRVARLLARQGADVRVASRQLARSEAACRAIVARVAGANVEAVATGTAEELVRALTGRTLAVAAGAAGVVLLPKSAPRAGLRVAIDLNAVPPLGIEGVEVGDKGKDREGITCYGAIGVGDTKMKIHKAAVARLFERSDQVIDAEEAYALAASF